MIERDVCRCHDRGCQEREQCERWIYRGDDRSGIPHSASLFPYDAPLHEPCWYRIEPSKT